MSEWPECVRHLPVCPHRNLPIPYIAEVGPDGKGEFTILDNRRALECVDGRLCAMCGLPMGWWVALIGDPVSVQPGGWFIEPPVHEACAEAAVGGLCPFLSRERVPRRMPQYDVAIVGSDRDDLAQVGRAFAKRPVIIAISHVYRTAFVPSTSGTPVMVYLPMTIARVRRFAYVGGKLAEQPAPAPVPAQLTRRIQPRRLPKSRRTTGRNTP